MRTLRRQQQRPRCPNERAVCASASSLPCHSCWMVLCTRVVRPSRPVKPGRGSPTSRTDHLRHERLACQLLDIPEVDFVAVVLACGAVELRLAKNGSDKEMAGRL